MTAGRQRGRALQRLILGQIAGQKDGALGGGAIFAGPAQGFRDGGAAKPAAAKPAQGH